MRLTLTAVSLALLAICGPVQAADQSIPREQPMVSAGHAKAGLDAFSDNIATISNYYMALGKSATETDLTGPNSYQCGYQKRCMLTNADLKFYSIISHAKIVLYYSMTAARQYEYEHHWYRRLLSFFGDDSNQISSEQSYTNPQRVALCNQQLMNANDQFQVEFEAFKRAYPKNELSLNMVRTSESLASVARKIRAAPKENPIAPDDWFSLYSAVNDSVAFATLPAMATVNETQSLLYAYGKNAFLNPSYAFVLQYEEGKRDLYADIAGACANPLETMAIRQRTSRQFFRRHDEIGAMLQNKPIAQKPHSIFDGS